jgi:hypothetical protein
MYRQELELLGKPDPGPMPPSATAVVFVAEDPQAYWQQIAPHLLHETNMYAQWAETAGIQSPYQRCDTVEELRRSHSYEVYSPTQMIEAARDMAANEPMLFHPLCGGIHPDLAWQSLQLFRDKVLPALG